MIRKSLQGFDHVCSQRHKFPPISVITRCRCGVGGLEGLLMALRCKVSRYSRRARAAESLLESSGASVCQVRLKGSWDMGSTIV